MMHCVFSRRSWRHTTSLGSVVDRARQKASTNSVAGGSYNRVAAGMPAMNDRILFSQCFKLLFVSRLTIDTYGMIANLENGKLLSD